MEGIDILGRSFYRGSRKWGRGLERSHHHEHHDTHLTSEQVCEQARQKLEQAGINPQEVSISFENGTLILSGEVDEGLLIENEELQSLPGVERVDNRLAPRIELQVDEDEIISRKDDGIKPREVPY